MINQTNILNEQQLKDLESLMNVCKAQDRSTPNFYLHILKQTRTLPASLLYYENDKLIAFLSIYFFYKDACEIAVIVDPAHRKKGIAKQLLTTIMPVIQGQNINNLIFSNPSQLNNQWLTAVGFHYLHSEYHMQRDDLNPVLHHNTALNFHIATVNDIQSLYALDEACFPKEQANMTTRFEGLIEDRDYLLFLVSINTNPIAKAHMRLEPGHATLSDIAVYPTLQGQGYGTALIAHCINFALSEGHSHLSLDVETRNQRALDLYIKLGFFIQNATDYWSIPIKTMNAVLNNLPVSP